MTSASIVAGEGVMVEFDDASAISIPLDRYETTSGEAAIFNLTSGEWWVL